MECNTLTHVRHFIHFLERSGANTLESNTFITRSKRNSKVGEKQRNKFVKFAGCDSATLNSYDQQSTRTTKKQRLFQRERSSSQFPFENSSSWCQEDQQQNKTQFTFQDEGLEHFKTSNTISKPGIELLRFLILIVLLVSGRPATKKTSPTSDPQHLESSCQLQSLGIFGFVCFLRKIALQHIGKYMKI